LGRYFILHSSATSVSTYGASILVETAVRCATKKWSFIMFNEVHSIHGHTLLLITKPSLQATALLQHLKQSLALTGKLHNIQRSLMISPAALFYWI
jgi:LuxR family transcriptional regulator of csgAB operon